MRRFFYLFIIVGMANASCPPRKSTMECFYKIADTNKDGIVTRHELSHAIFNALSWYEKVPFRLFGGIEQIMKDCDENRDNKLTVEESMRLKKCMDSCFKRKHTRDKFKC